MIEIPFFIPTGVPLNIKIEKTKTVDELIEMVEEKIQEDSDFFILIHKGRILNGKTLISEIDFSTRPYIAIHIDKPELPKFIPIQDESQIKIKVLANPSRLYDVFNALQNKNPKVAEQIRNDYNILLNILQIQPSELSEKHMEILRDIASASLDQEEEFYEEEEEEEFGDSNGSDFDYSSNDDTDINMSLDHIRSLTSMGYSSNDVIQALVKNNNDFEKAKEFLKDLDND